MEKVYDYNGLSINYYVTGNQSGETIVMLHPAFADYHIFTPQFKAYGEEFYVIAIDMIGHGKSELGNSQINMKDMPLIVSNIMDIEQRKEAHLLGVSLGSLVVQGVADVFSYKVKSVTVVGGYSIHKDNKDIMKAQQKEMGKWLFYLIFSLKRFKQHIVDASCYSEPCREVFENSLAGFKRKQLMSMNGMDKIMTKKNDPVDYPLLIICGEHDLDLATDFGKHWVTIEPKGSYVEIPDAGHCANMDNPIYFNDVFSDFIQGKYHK